MLIYKKEFELEVRKYFYLENIYSESGFISCGFVSLEYFFEIQV